MVQTSAGAGKEAKRAEILRRAAAVFRERGFHGAGMREIAARLGLAPGALYYYFESKNDLLYSCQMLSLRGLVQSAGAVVASSATPEEKVRQLVHHHLEQILGEMGGSFAHIEFHALDRDRLAEVVARRDAYESLVRRIIQEGVDAGAFRPLDSKIAALTLLGAMNWAAVWWNPQGHRSPADVAEDMAATFVRGWKT
ncbi:MAG: TetR/AcrR family transcriptional regulator [Pseudomonadota bacterium]